MISYDELIISTYLGWNLLFQVQLLICYLLVCFYLRISCGNRFRPLSWRGLRLRSLSNLVLLGFSCCFGFSISLLALINCFSHIYINILQKTLINFN